MASEGSLIVSVSGIRGIVGDGLTVEAATAFAAALGAHANGGSMVLSRDGRPSGETLRHADGADDGRDPDAHLRKAKRGTL